MPVVPYTTMQWEWDEAKFQLKTPLRELSESISLRISSLDEELKIKVTEMNVLKGSLQTIERKTQGNLMVRAHQPRADPAPTLRAHFFSRPSFLALRLSICW